MLTGQPDSHHVATPHEVQYSHLAQQSLTTLYLYGILSTHTAASGIAYERLQIRWADAQLNSTGHQTQNLCFEICKHLTSPACSKKAV